MWVTLSISTYFQILTLWYYIELSALDLVLLVIFFFSLALPSSTLVSSSCQSCSSYSWAQSPTCPCLPLHFTNHISLTETPFLLYFSLSKSYLLLESSTSSNFCRSLYLIIPVHSIHHPLHWVDSTHSWGFNYGFPVLFINDFNKLQYPWGTR